MFRTVFKSAVRHASLHRSYSTRAARPLYSRHLILGASLVASSLAFLPLACVDNDADQAKVESDKKSTKLGDHKGESTYNVEDSSTKPSEVIPEDHPDKSAKRKSSEKATEEASKKAEKEFSNKEKNDSSENKSTESSENKATPDDDNAGDHEGEQSAAYNPETGEINWDCPCLGGMAHGPCGEEFKAAFSCFIYSETEPKGIDCIQKFEGMRTCFRQHPEHYKEELYEDDEPVPSTDSDKPQESEPKVSEKEAPKESATEDISKVA